MCSPSTLFVGGVRARLWRAPQPRAAILFICGNPGVTSYYTEYLTQLYDALHGQCTILCKGSLGIDETGPEAPPPTGVWPFRYYGLEDQIASQSRALDTLRDLVPPSTPLFVQGHSLGAFMALQLLNMHADKIHAMYLLFPAICHIAQAPQARITRTFLFMPVFALVNMMCWILSRIPRSWLYWIIGHTSLRYSPDATADLVARPYAVATAVYMFHDELRMIKDIPTHVAERAKDKIVRSYWGQGDSDSWSTSFHRRHAESALRLDRWQNVMHTAPPSKHTSTECQDALPHAFCLRHSEAIARITSRWVQADGPGPHGPLG